MTDVKLIAQVKLQPAPEQAASLEKTVRHVNEACNFISSVAWKQRVFGKYALQKLCYREVRERFGLSAQLAVRAMAKVADAYKLDKQTKRKFKPWGAIGYDDRILRWYIEKGMVSINTLDGRLKIPFVCGERQRALLKTRQGESDFVCFRGNFFLSATCQVEEAEPFEPTGALGIDLGIVNLAVDSDDEIYSAKTVNNVRARNRRLRSKLQKKGTKSTKRLLKALSGRERRFAKDVNHTLSKKMVAKAQDTQRALAVEDLTGIRARTTVRRTQRATFSSWSFFQLRSFLSYKAERAGVPVILVDPRNTSRTCPNCGCLDKRNRLNQAAFQCVSCGLAGHADTFAAMEIRRRAEVMLPYVSRPIAPPSGGAGTSPRPLVVGS